jgi:hypothetical protein
VHAGRVFGGLIDAAPVQRCAWAAVEWHRAQVAMTPPASVHRDTRVAVVRDRPIGGLRISTVTSTQPNPLRAWYRRHRGAPATIR